MLLVHGGLPVGESMHQWWSVINNSVAGWIWGLDDPIASHGSKRNAEGLVMAFGR